MFKTTMFTLALTLSVATTGVKAQTSEFSGDIKLACEAVLCLSSGTRPAECAPALHRYFNINHRKFYNTLRARNAFLNLCPAASHDAYMTKLINDITNGAGRCDPGSLNSYLLTSAHQAGDNYMLVISNTLPSHCTNYMNNNYTDIAPPKYVGIPERKGFWTDEANYESELAAYTARVKAEDKAKELR